MTRTEQTPTADSAEASGGRRLRRLLGALAGLLSALVALGVAELAAALVGPASSPVIAIATFGENDKIALVVGALAAATRPASDQLVCRFSDGMTIGTPTRSALEVGDAMLAFGMNGEPLPVEHGFPVRMLIPGRYGYVSACTWLTRIEATTFEAVDASWVERGWAADGPITIASRIATPAALRSFPAGRRAIAGVAWAQTRGTARVEVEVDDEDWAEADLSPEIDDDLWRHRVLPYDFSPGSHSLTVRATSADGELQTDDRAAPFPAGASGRHSIQVVVA
jgi:hypothetical protein